MQNMNYFVSEKATIGSNVSIGHGAIIYDNVEIGDNTFIGPYAIIGEHTMGYYANPESHVNRKTVIGKNSNVRAFTIIYEDVLVGDYFQTGHHAIIREKTRIGHHSSVGSDCELPSLVTLGNYVRLHSKVMLCENVIIEDYVWIFPNVVITNAKHPPVSGLSTTIVREYAQILTQAVLLPGLEIGKNAIIGAGALVTKNVGEERLVIGNPAKDVKSVRELLDDSGNVLYPWAEHLKDYRGYPWQTKPE